jgi:hypothetical protein
MIVQIYEVADRAEAVALAALGVDHVGVLVGSGQFPRELAPAAARVIFEALPAASRWRCRPTPTRSRARSTAHGPTYCISAPRPST